MRKKIQKYVCGVLFVLMIFVFAGCGTDKKAADKDEASVQKETVEESVSEPAVSESLEEEADNAQEPEVEGLEFPLLLDSDKLELSSVFEYTGINLDFEGVFAEEIGAIQLKNLSGQHLRSAQITVKLSNGQNMMFVVEDIPAEKDVLAFETQNQIYDDTVKVVEVSVNTEYFMPEFEEIFSYTVNGSDITVENISGKDQNNITLYYHCMIDGLCFGGQSYELLLGTLAAGESATVSDSECYMGDVVVTNIVAE